MVRREFWQQRDAIDLGPRSRAVNFGIPRIITIASWSDVTLAMDMDKLVSLCKRRGFLFQSSEIYGGLNGFWDYGPLGVELKRNVKEAWWRDMVTGHDDLDALAGRPAAYEMVGLDCTIIMHPQVWKCSGHYDLFHDLHGRLPRVEEALSPRPGSRPLGRGQGTDGSSSPRRLGGDEGLAETAAARR